MKFTMPFEPMVIEHLGLKLYSTLPPVISEFVSNAYDAESPKVEITLPSGKIKSNSEVIIRDYGHGLDKSEIQDEFLPIGRQRRGVDGSKKKSKNSKRVVTGRKGLGKLSAFGIALEMEVTFYKSKKACCLKLNYNDMKKWAKTHTADQPYEPKLILSRTGSTIEPDGVEIRLRKLFRKKSIAIPELRRGLARRLNFIGTNFQVRINGNQIQPGDRIQKKDCAKNFVWDISEVPENGKVSDKLKVKGWIGFLETSSQTNRGIDIFANHKAAELESFFNYSSTHAQFARAHLVGEIHADFLDDKDDLVSTARNSVIWESVEGQQLQNWGQKLLAWVFSKWVDLRKEEKKDTIIKHKGFDKWLDTRTPSERRTADKLVKILIDDPAIETSSATSLLDIVKGSVETMAFIELVDAIEAEGANAATLIKLFDEWRIIEAREHLRVADGRTEALEQLEKFMNTGALEVSEMQPLLEKNPWLIDKSWTEVDVQSTYTKLIRENCKEPRDYSDKDRRLDIWGVNAGGGVKIVEIKRPDKTLTRKDLEQIEKYVDWARNQFDSSGVDSPKYIHGLLVVGKLSSQGDIKTKIQRLAGDDIRVVTYQDLYHISKEYYREVEKQLAKIAPEYTKSKRKKK